MQSWNSLMLPTHIPHWAMGESMWLSLLYKCCGRTRAPFSSHLQGWPYSHITHWSPSRRRDMLHKICMRNVRFRTTIHVSAAKPKLPSPHSHQWNTLPAGQLTVWDSTCTCPHSPLAFRGYSPQYWLTHTSMVSSSCWHHNSCVSQNWPSASQGASVLNQW